MERKHSGLGFASFIINIAVIFIVLVTLALSNLFDPLLGRIPLSIYFVSPFVSMLALGLGIAGLLQKDRKKVFAILGTLLSLLILLFSVCVASLLIFQVSSGM